jgi:leucyl/phenylalanyl-tRNA--protein transferase
MNKDTHRTRPLQWPLLLHPDDETTPFPPASLAMREPNGLLAIGGSLTPARLKQAYRSGIFPWFSQGQEILWWSPDPRAVLFPEKIRISRSLRKSLRNNDLEVVFDRAFVDVMRACAAPRAGQPGTWITEDMIEAYATLHALGIAHSIEVYQAGRLVGGLYGVAMGTMFFGESMFSRQRDASKIALVWLSAQLRQWGYRAIDCQLPSAHLLGLGAQIMPRRDFLTLLNAALARPGKQGAWQPDSDLDAVMADST